MRFNVEIAVRKRTSVRTYAKKRVESEIKQQILEYAKGQENPLGPSARFKFIDKTVAESGDKLGTYGVIKGAELYLGAAIGEDEFAMEALGYQLEELILYMTSLGLGTCWLGGTFNKGAFAQAMELKDGEIFPIITPVGYQAEKKSIVETLMQATVKPRQRMPWEKLFFSGDFDHPMMKEEAGKYKLPLELVRLAPSAVNKQPWRIVLKDGKFHFFKASTMGTGEAGSIDLQRLDVGIAVCHFHLASKECGMAGNFERKCPAGLEIPDNMTYIVSWIPE